MKCSFNEKEMEDARKRNRIYIVIRYEQYVKEKPKFVFSEWKGMSQRVLISFSRLNIMTETYHSINHFV